MGNSTSGDLTLGTFTQVYLTKINLPKILYTWLWYLKKYSIKVCYFSEFKSDTCVKVLHTKKDKFPTKNV